ncbi:MAG: hypothetical protein ISR54_01320 [Chlorobium phaeobacteroides]|uniref:Uncharacterized protein n=1 Tax=Chlorobium phaeobacteroides (strain BS1) TaxID=331678 RepID=B3EMH6_CHLPB|nr:hypothetical protein [Chlorobium phaeobacteroides]
MYPAPFLKTGKKLKTTDSHAGLDPASMHTLAPTMDSRVKHGNDRKGKVSRPCTPFISSFGE